MPELPRILRKSPDQHLRTFAWFTASTVAAAIVTAIATALWNLGWLWVLLVANIATLSLLSYFAMWIARPLFPLRHWRTLTETTDLVDYAAANKESEYMPSPILERELIRHLCVMGNGCGKWTRKVAPALARRTFEAIRRRNGSVRFMASCPVNLAATDDARQKAKAIRNAKSLLALRELEKETTQSGGLFEIRTYKHLATLRLIIVNDNECIVGHYQEDGIGDSLDTPLLVFRCNDENDWGFGHAFRRLFESEWNRAVPPSDSEWIEIERLGR
jgi:hypothetical protein